jgi:hypothetical protein
MTSSQAIDGLRIELGTKVFPQGVHENAIVVGGMREERHR